MTRRTIIRGLLITGAAAIALAAGALLFAWSGLYSVAASAGHWEITRWFLQFAMRQSVETHSIGTKVPDLGDTTLIVQGAGHFHTGCAPCHGTVEGDAPSVARGMTPPPPLLSPVIDDWSAAELFWVVKHGIKYTGMPAWPNQVRDDEVWSVVAFLERLPQLDPESYRRLALGEEAEPESGALTEPRVAALGGVSAAVLDNCARCHGRDGLGRSEGAFPKLAGQAEDYLYESLASFAAGRRASGFMQPIADGLTDSQWRALAAYYSDLPPGEASRPDPDRSLYELGQVIAAQGVKADGVPSCAPCHDAPEANPTYPRLAGQPASYLAQQLRLFRQGVRGGTEYASIMTAVAQTLSDRHIAAVTTYYSATDPAGK